jgi:hypothetical protein
VVGHAKGEVAEAFRGDLIALADRGRKLERAPSSGDLSEESCRFVTNWRGRSRTWI